VNAIFVGLLGWGTVALALVLFAILLLAAEVGYRFGRWSGSRRGRDQHDHAVTATLTSGMVGLLAFILGLTVNFAQSRYEARRELVVTEANAIGTAWLRARLVGGPEGEAIAGVIRAYAETRLDFTLAPINGPLDALNARTAEEAEAIWGLASKAAAKAPTPITATLITALNQMFDSAQAQRFAFLGEAPRLMLDLMALGSILSIGALGYEMGVRGRRQLVLSCLLLLMWTGAMYVTVDLSRPRLGLERVDVRPLQWTIQEMDRTTSAAHP